MIQTHLKEVGIDYPQPNETIKPGSYYSMRVTAPADAKEVRVTIDDGPWQECRRTDGHWWFDMKADARGEHVAVGRVIESDGSMIVTQPRLFRIV